MDQLGVFLLAFVAGITTVNGINTYDFCSDIYNRDIAVIYQLAKGKTYFSRKPCSMEFTPAPGSKVMIRVLSNTVGCAYGSLKLYDPSSSSTPKMIFCGHQVQPVVYASGKQKIKLTFSRTSLPWRADNGFSLLVTSFRDDKPCHYDEFECNNDRCISNALLCDGYNNCGDGSDEARGRCHKRITTSTTSSSIACGYGEFTCDNGNCVLREFKCDGDDDCGDNSDETSGCHGHSTGTIFGSLIACIIFIVIVVVLIFARYRWYIRAGAVIMNAQSGPSVTSVTTVVVPAAPPVQAVPPPCSPARAPYPPSQYDPGYGY